MQAKITRKFPFKGKTYTPGMLVEGAAAYRAIADMCGVPHNQPVEKAMVPGRNKAARAPRNK